MGRQLSLGLNRRGEAAVLERAQLDGLILLPQHAEHAELWRDEIKLLETTNYLDFALVPRELASYARVRRLESKTGGAFWLVKSTELPCIEWRLSRLVEDDVFGGGRLYVDPNWRYPADLDRWKPGVVQEFERLRRFIQSRFVRRDGRWESRAE